MKKNVPRAKDIFIDQEKKKKKLELEAKRESERRSERIKTFFGFGKNPKEPELKKSSPAPPAKTHKASKFRIFEDPVKTQDPRVLKKDHKFRPKTDLARQLSQKNNVYTRRSIKFDPLGELENDNQVDPKQYPTFGHQIQKEKVEKQQEGMFDRIKNFFRADKPNDEPEIEVKAKGPNNQNLPEIKDFDGELSVPPVQVRPNSHKYFFKTPRSVKFHSKKFFKLKFRKRKTIFFKF